MTVRRLGLGSRAAGWLGAVALALAAAGCGGGGGGGGDPAPSFSEPPAAPPAAAATIGFTTGDAVDLTKASVAAAEGVVARQNALSSLGALLGVQVASSDVPVSLAPALGLAVRGAARPDRARILATTTDPCTEVVSAPCTGTVTTDTNISATATSVTPGQYIDATFNNITGVMGTASASFSGRMRIEFLTGFNETSTSLAGLGLRIKLVAFAGSIAGNAFGPVNTTMDLTFNAQGVPSLVTGGIQFDIVSGVSITGSGSYSITTATTRLGYGAAATGYVEVRLSNWRSSGGRPAVGSLASLQAGNIIPSVQVTASSATSVTYSVSIIGPVPGSTRFFTVTAQYPTGGGAPTYTAVAGT